MYMNRKKDLENIGLLYESAFLDADEENDVKTFTDVQKMVVNKLEGIGYHVNKIRTVADPVENVIHMSKNSPGSREEAEVTLRIDADGSIDGQPYESALADLDEGEESSSFGQELQDSELNMDPIENYEDNEDLGPNQQPEGWGDEAMDDETPGMTANRFDQDEQEPKKESYHSKADRDWSILAESYLNIQKS